MSRYLFGYPGMEIVRISQVQLNNDKLRAVNFNLNNRVFVGNININIQSLIVTTVEAEMWFPHSLLEKIDNQNVSGGTEFYFSYKNFNFLKFTLFEPELERLFKESIHAILASCKIH